MTKNFFINASIVLALTILSINLVFAFGISSSYWVGNPLKLNPGESRTVGFTLQNMGTTEDLRVRVDLALGNEIAKLEKNEYLVKAGTKDTVVSIDFKIPSDAIPGTKYNIQLTTKTITPGGTGVVFGTGMDSSFEVEVIPKAAEIPKADEKPVEQESSEMESLKDNSFNIGFGIFLVIIAIVVIIIFFVRNKRVKTKNKKKK